MGLPQLWTYGPMCWPLEMRVSMGKTQRTPGTLRTPNVSVNSVVSLHLCCFQHYRHHVSYTRQKGLPQQGEPGDLWQMGNTRVSGPALWSLPVLLGCDNFLDTNHPVSALDLKYYTWSNEKLLTSQHRPLINESLRGDWLVCLVLLPGMTEAYFKKYLAAVLLRVS